MLAADKRTDARKLYEVLSFKTQPDHVQLAAARGIELTVGNGNADVAWVNPRDDR